MQSIAHAPELLLELGRALHEAGSPAHRIEETMSAVATGAGLDAQVFSAPTLLMVSTREDGDSRTHMTRVAPKEYDIARLIAVDAILDRAARGELPLADAVQELRSTEHQRYPRWTKPLSYLATGATVAVLFGGSAVDVGATALVATLTGLVALGRWRTLHLFHLTAAVVASVAGSLANRWLGGSATTIVLASLIVLVPGLSLTLGLIELATRHLSSGTARLMGAIIAFLELGFGVALGQRIVELTMGPAAQISSSALPPWAALLVVV
ncbi:MAG: threonine/serine exporter family protein, partial [Myxococcota bacterium]